LVDPEAAEVEGGRVREFEVDGREDEADAFAVEEVEGREESVEFDDGREAEGLGVEASKFVAL
jgi:hypothetical protein